MLEKLKQLGFNTEEAMQYCANQTSIYREVLETAYTEGMQKIPLLQECVQNKDFKRYAIEVHAVKSTAKTIGAVALYEVAERLNQHAKAGEEEPAYRGNEDLVELYRKTLQAIEDAIKE